MSKSLTSSLNPQNGYPIKRKVIDISGRLGSLYDASTDNLIDRHSAENFERRALDEAATCRVFAGDPSKEPTSYLRNIDFDDAIQRSIRLYMVAPTGIGRLIEYNQPINQNTRFLYYSYRTRKEKLPVKARKAARFVSPPTSPTAATHMITKIVWGIEFVCIIQISNNQKSINAVDRLLLYLCQQLKRNEIPIQFSNDQQNLINQLTNMTVYGSETCIDNQNLPLLTILNRIPDWQHNINFHQPLIYTMQPLRWLYNNIQFRESCADLDQVNPHLNRVDPLLRRIENQLKAVNKIFLNLPVNFPSSTLNHRLDDAQQQYRILLDTQEDLQQRLRKTIPDVRRHRIEPTELDNIIADQRYQCLHRTEIEKFQSNVERLSWKAILIEQLKKDHIEYINAFDVRPSDTDSPTNEEIDAILKRSHSNEKHPVIFWYSSDRLKREQADRWQQIYRHIITERKQTTHLIYVDFTNCQQRLQGFTVVQLPVAGSSETTFDPIIEVIPGPLRSNSVPSLTNLKSKPLSPSADQQRRSMTPPPLPTQPLDMSPSLTSLASSTFEKTEINVLLIGETGVGKSTFINTFVNYLKFESLQQAERDEPVVLIPGSFIISIDDQVNQFVVKFGNPDPNENYEHQDQSVTQQCKSYIFDLNETIRLRLIDTPGINDMQGIDHILTYINNFSHLNAICLLLKSNISQLDSLFHLCIDPLLTYLAPVGYNNIIFCFTNACATSYDPSETSLLLQKRLIDENLNIPFLKENTFSFDSGSFRYLMARKRRVEFNAEQRKECTDSWNISMAESVRLLDFIQTRQPYYPDDWLSPKKAALDITTLARPLMETLRLIIYNSKLSEAKLLAYQIVLNSTEINVDMCIHCAQTNLIDLGPFWLVQYRPIISKNNENQHELCPSDGKQFLIEAIVQHEVIAQPTGLKNERWQSSFQNFLLKCDRLLHFLRQQGEVVENDPFQLILDRFLEEENQISQIRNIRSHMNRRVREVLQSLKEKRQVNSQQLLETNENLSINEVYEIINELTVIPTVQKQVDSIKKSQQLKMKQHEYQVPTNIIRNQIFS